VKLDSTTGEARDTALWSEDFDAVEVFNDSDFDSNRERSVADWFALLNKGQRVFAVGNSDSHGLRTSPVGYPRTCFPFGHDDPRQLTPGAVRDQILAGSGVVSGGLQMRVRGPADVGPGGSVSPGDVVFDITVEGASWIAAQDLEVIVAGVTVDTIPLVASGPGPANHYELQVTVPLQAAEWVVFHARGVGDLAPLPPGRRPFAVSNPVFVE
jgi:hypothetical protein